jgi:hypothetical protein
MKLKIDLDFSEFWSEFESYNDYVEDLIKSEIKAYIKGQTRAYITKHPQWALMVKKEAERAMNKALEELGG